MSDEIRTTEERYQSAVNARNLFQNPDRITDVDTLAAAGWTEFSAGVTLMRLQAEFEAGQKPRRPTSDTIKDMIAAMAASGKTYTVEEAMADALGWYANEIKLFFVKLRSYRAASEQLQAIAGRFGLDPGPVPAVIYWWLDQTCNVCDGHGRTKAPGAPMLSGHACQVCRGVGKKPIPAGNTGRGWANVLDILTARAKTAIRRRTK